MSDILSKFMNIWEIESHFKCPVVGAILPVEKHKNILKKCGYDVKRMKAYEYHQQIMAKLDGANNVSIKVNNFIRTKAHKLMHRITTLPDSDIRSLWKKHLETGNVGPMMYAIISYEDTSVELLQNVFGEVHMQAHANMTEIFHIRQRQIQADENFTQLKKKLALKNEKFKTLVEARKSDTEKISLLQTENLKIKKRSNELENILHPGEKAKNTIHCLEQKIADREQDLEAEQEKMRAMEREKRSLQIDLFSSRGENELMRKEFQAMITGFIPCTSINCPNEDYCIEEACPQYKLCAKRIFMIGGITKMKSFYRDIVENAGGKFDYHDGYLKTGNAHFEAKVKKCDMVLCPVNCNSHNACLRVKKLCKKHNKAIKFLNSSSLSAVSQALFITENESAVN
jgi:hypothetical protein